MNAVLACATCHGTPCLCSKRAARAHFDRAALTASVIALIVERGEVHRRELVHALDVPHAVVRYALEQLEESGRVTSERKSREGGRMRRYYALSSGGQR